MALQTGMDSSTQDHYLIGPGQAYLNFTDWNNKGTTLGATSGGNSFDLGIDWYESDIDGAMGPVKGGKRIAAIEPVLTINLLEHTANNWIRALAGGTSTTLDPTYNLEDVGEGDSSTQTFTLSDLGGSGNLFENTLKVYLDGALQTRGTGEDYTYDDSTQEITFSTAPGTDVTITATYTYDDTGSSDTFDKLTLSQITDSDFLDSIALVGEISDSSKTNDGVILVKNVLPGNFSVDLPGDSENESVLSVDFTGHFDPADGMDLDNAPVEIWYPQA